LYGPATLTEPAVPLYEPYNPGVALTVGDLLKISSLPLARLTGTQGLTNPIRWVHVSELEDPTPFLKGGELLLTVGLGVGATAAKQRAYVRRLIDAGLSGLGFGSGFAFKRPPKAVISEADKGSFPVFEVPYETPFIAITEAVFTRLVAEQYDLLSRSLDAEHTLTKSVLDGKGLGGIVQALTTATGGWALLLDLHGQPIVASPKTAVDGAGRLWLELQGSAVAGGRFSVSMTDGGNHVSIQPVTSQGRTDAYLAFGKKHAPTQFDRVVTAHALALIALELSKVRAVSETERRLKGDVLERILSGQMNDADARRALERVGFDLLRPLAAFALSSPATNPAELAAAAEDALAREPGPLVVSARPSHVLVMAQPASNGYLGGFRAQVAARVGGTVRAGAGNPAMFERLEQAAREARYALQACEAERRDEAEFANLGTYQLLLSLQDPEALSTFAASVLAPIDAYDEAHGGHLIPSLRAFLERNARWEAAANDLYVHRHTLRYRMRKIEELTQRDLTSARDRMELFLALRARDLLAVAD
jgi:purine catabolism regulator